MAGVGRGGEDRLDRMQPMDMAERQPKLEGQRQQGQLSPRPPVQTEPAHRSKTRPPPHFSSKCNIITISPVKPAGG
jgi:hypothetical protein